MVRLLMNILFFCTYSGRVGVGYLNFRKVFGQYFLSLIMIPFFSGETSWGGLDAYIIDLSMSIHPIKNSFPTKFSCYNIKVQNRLEYTPCREVAT